MFWGSGSGEKRSDYPVREPVNFPYPLYRDPDMERLKLAHIKQNQVTALMSVLHNMEAGFYLFLLHS